MPPKRTPDIKPKNAKANAPAKKSTSEKADARAAKQKEENLRLKEEIRSLKKNRAVEDTFSYNFAPYILAFAALFSAVCFCIPEKMSFVGKAAQMLCGLLSVGALFIPICLLIGAILWKRDMRAGRVRGKVVLHGSFIVSVSCVWELVGLAHDRASFEGYRLIGENSLYLHGKSYAGGGIVGGVIANFLEQITGVGAWILCIFILLLLAFAVCGITPVDIAAFLSAKYRECRYNARVRQKENLKRVRDNDKKEHEVHTPEAVEPAPGKKKAYLGGIGDEKKPSAEVTPAPAPIEAPSEPTVPDNAGETEKKKHKRKKTDEFPPLAISPDELRLATGDAPFASEDETERPLDTEASEDDETVPWDTDTTDAPGIDADEAVAPDPSVYDSIKQSVRFVSHEDEGGEDTDVPKEVDLSEIFTADAVIASAGVQASTSRALTDGAGKVETSDIVSEDTDSEREEVKVEPKPNPAELYRFPDIDFLQKDPNPATFSVTEEIKSTSVKLVETLANFGVKTKITNICCGPTVTRYELQPEIGVRVKSIQNLSDDIALHLAAAGVRIEAPIPGKQAVGIEIPNKTVSTVYIRNLIENPKFAQQKSRLSVCLGMDVAGSPVFMDIAKMPHLLIAGATGMGKSVCINSFIVSLLYKARPDECKLLLIDPKKVEFGVYNGMPHLLVPVVSDPKKAAGSLAWAVNEMERRFQLIEEVGVRDIDSYNKVTENDPEKEHMPKVVIIIDELADLMMTARDSVENSICRIAQKARAAGMHLVIGTQRPSVDVITGLIKANVPSRIACTVASQVDSRTIIDVAGAEKLLGRGDMLYAPVGCMKPIRVQGSFVTDTEIEKIIDFLKSESEAEYDTDIIDSIEREAEHCGEKKKGRGSADDGGDDYDADDRDAILDSDEAMFDAIKVAVDANMISTSLLQRKLSLGYSRAARIVDKLEKIGVVGPFEGSKPRKVLITPEEYLEMKMNHGR